MTVIRSARKRSSSGKGAVCWHVLNSWHACCEWNACWHTCLSMLTYLIEHVNIVRLYVDMWRSVDIHVVGDIHVNILDGTSWHVFYEYVNMPFGNMSTGGIIMTCMLLFDVCKLMCQVETYDHQLNLFLMRDLLPSISRQISSPSSWPDQCCPTACTTCST